ncbi:hypothetical protein KIN20_035146, partial [Parelaphostrongylus tenuis]
MVGNILISFPIFQIQLSEPCICNQGFRSRAIASIIESRITGFYNYLGDGEVNLVCTTTHGEATSDIICPSKPSARQMHHD